MCDAFTFGIGAAFLHPHNSKKNIELILAKSRFFAQADLRLSTLMREYTTITYS